MIPEMNNIEPCELERDYHAIMTITLEELISQGVFSWDMEALQGCFDGLGQEDADRLKDMFTGRYMWREISMAPPARWLQQLNYRIKYELVPKYKPLYDAIASGDFSPLNDENEYMKERRVNSDYPETLISHNSVYLSAGQDKEYQRIKATSGVEAAMIYAEQYKNVDTMFIDDLAIFFTDLWTTHYNGL